MARPTRPTTSSERPSRSDEFATATKRIPKLVASRSITDVSAWSNSSLVDGDLFAAIEQLKRERGDTEQR